MKIVVFNLKGGQGKTSIAINLALSMNMSVITNDQYTTINEVLPEGYYLIVKYNEKFPEIEEDIDVIYDLGGYIDIRTAKIIKESDLVIIPIINSDMNNKASVATVMEVLNINRNILVVANATEKNDLETVKYTIKKYTNTDLPTLQIRKTTAFNKIINRKKSIKEITENDPLLNFSYKEIVKQFEELVNYVKNIRNNK